MTENKIISIANLTKKYGKTIALNDFSISLEKGKIVGLLGPNGSGKTTMIKILNGLLKDYSGEVLIDGHGVGKYSKSIISYLPDVSYIPTWMKVNDIIKMFEEMYQDFDTKKCYTILDRLNILPTMKVSEMSKGTKEKLQLALVMARKAKIYILDEPIGGVDPAARDLIIQVILDNYDPDSLILFSTHLIADIEKIFDEVIFIKNGELILHQECEKLRNDHHKSIDEIFREVFKC
ncbi:MAG: ABC transporter ATP-binding protein [Erysipelotrichaceae bacterium]|nr:ABC transporter ATP-binding protein [Erysipelotrichaceae bacterium]MDY5251177.1 ABC transporter ATP-binding protein [Erysipelotrichaceae bacterium]